MLKNRPGFKPTPVSQQHGVQTTGPDHILVFLWAAKTLHGANLNNQYRKKSYYPVSQNK